MNLNSKSINLDEHSVVYLADSNFPFVSSKTFKIAEAFEGMKRDFGKVVSEGLDCEALVPGSRWRKGKVRICFEFYPQDAEDEKKSAAENLGHKETANGAAVDPLDEIRQEIC
jgi:hypothetical protein